jgi:hypothetical protein
MSLGSLFLEDRQGASAAIIGVDWIRKLIAAAIDAERAAAAGEARRKTVGDAIDAARAALRKFPIDVYLSVFEAIKSLDAAAAPEGNKP